MKKEQGQDTTKELVKYLLPAGTLDYFELTHIVQDKEGLVLFLEEKNEVPAEHKDQKLHSKGFLPAVSVQDFPIREHKVVLNIKRRRWENHLTGEIISRNWDLVMQGARLTKEFALFLKGARIITPSAAINWAVFFTLMVIFRSCSF